MPTVIYSYALDGLEGRQANVAVQLHPGQGFDIAGLSDRARREAQVRVVDALRTRGFDLPVGRIRVQVSPGCAWVSHEAAELAIAVGILIESGQVSAPADGVAIVGALALDGRVRPVGGMLPIAEAAQRDGRTALLVAADAMTEAAIVEGLALRGISTLADVPEALAGGSRDDRPTTPADAEDPEDEDAEGWEWEGVIPMDYFAEGEEDAVKRVSAAVTAGRSVLIVGRQVDKVMMARKAWQGLATLARGEAVEVTRIHSACGNRQHGLMTDPPLATVRYEPAPNDSRTSPTALLGRGPRPGLVTLAHRGVMFLDGIDHLERETVSALCDTARAGSVTTIEHGREYELPAATTLVAGAGPCACLVSARWPRKRCGCIEEVREEHAQHLAWLSEQFDEVIVLPEPAGE